MDKVIDEIVGEIIISWNTMCRQILTPLSQNNCFEVHETMANYHDKFLEIMEQLPEILEIAKYDDDENIRILTDISQYISEFQELGVEYVIKNPPACI